MTRDESLMGRALECAARAWGQTSPNPMVGAVLAQGDAVLAEAWHHQAGQSHAEPQVLEQLGEISATGSASEGSDDPLTLYVNLEPCNHEGRTPPCTEAILASPVRRVVVAVEDPDPRVAGQGITRLRQAGLQVDVGVRADEALGLNHAFWGRQLRQRPFVALKVALSADDCIARAGGGPTAITADEARVHTHKVRAGLDAILVGIETLRQDRPRLDTRLFPGSVAPQRWIIDPALRIQPEWLHEGADKPIVVCSGEALLALTAAQRQAWDDRVVFQVLPGNRTHLDVEALPAALEAHGAWSVLVEGGGETQRRFFEAGLWDRFYLYRNTGLQLQGEPWTARDAWQAQSAVAQMVGMSAWDDTLCQVWTHIDAWPAAVGEARHEA